MNPNEHYSLKPSVAGRPGPALPAGLVAVVQTPFVADGGLDPTSEKLASALIDFYLTLEGELTQAREGLDSPRQTTQNSVTRS